MPARTISSPYSRRSAEKRSTLLQQRARFMQAEPTPSEAALWRELSGSKLGIRFIRQAVISRFIVDFLAPAARLVVEVDGGYHSRRVAADARRDELLQRLGFRVLRIPASLVAAQLEEAVSLVRRALGFQP